MDVRCFSASRRPSLVVVNVIRTLCVFLDLVLAIREGTMEGRKHKSTQKNTDCAKKCLQFSARP